MTWLSITVRARGDDGAVEGVIPWRRGRRRGVSERDSSEGSISIVTSSGRELDMCE